MVLCGRGRQQGNLKASTAASTSTVTVTAILVGHLLSVSCAHHDVIHRNGFRNPTSAARPTTATASTETTMGGDNKQSLYRKLQHLFEWSTKIGRQRHGGVSAEMCHDGSSMLQPQDANEDHAKKSGGNNSGNLSAITNAQHDMQSTQEDCVNLLDEITAFLHAWRRLRNRNGLPVSILRNIYMVIVKNIGTAHQHLRQNLLMAISAQRDDADCQVLYLDMLPLALLLSQDNAQTVIERDVIPAFESAVRKNPKMVFALLQCLAQLHPDEDGYEHANTHPSTASTNTEATAEGTGRAVTIGNGDGDNDKEDFLFQFAIRSLAWVEDEDFTALFHEIIAISNSDAHVRHCIHALRNEVGCMVRNRGRKSGRRLELLADICHALSCQLHQRHQQRGHPIQQSFAKTYFCIIEELLGGTFNHDEGMGTVQQARTHTMTSLKHPSRIICVDVYVMLKLCEMNQYRASILSTVRLLGMNGKFPYGAFDAMVCIPEMKPVLANDYLTTTLVTWFVRLMQSDADDDSHDTASSSAQLKPCMTATYKQMTSQSKIFFLEGLQQADKRRNRQVLVPLEHSTTNQRESIGTQAEVPAARITPSPTLSATLVKVPRQRTQRRTRVDPARRLYLGFVADIASSDDWTELSSTIRYLIAELEAEECSETADMINRCVIAVLQNDTNAGSASLRGFILSAIRNLLMGLSDTSLINALRLYRRIIDTDDALESRDAGDRLKHCVFQLFMDATYGQIDYRIGSEALCCMTTMAVSCPTPKDGLRAFKVMQQGLTNAGLVLNLDWYLAQHQSHKSKGDLGFQSYTSFFPQHHPTDNANGHAESPSSRNLVFSTSTLLTDAKVNSTSTWMDTCRWVHDLTYEYLKVGRTIALTRKSSTPSTPTSAASKWKPEAWLKSPIEFSSTYLDCFNATTARQMMLLRCLQQCLGSFELNGTEAEFTLHERELQEILFCINPEYGILGLVQELKRYCLSLLIGMGLSSAILSNLYTHHQDELAAMQTQAHAHAQVRGHSPNLSPAVCASGQSFSSSVTSGNVAANDVTLRQLSYQLAKLFTIRGKLPVIKQMLKMVVRSMEAPKKKSGKQLSKQTREIKRKRSILHRMLNEDNQLNLGATVQTICETIDVAFQQFFQPNVFIDAGVLWTCLGCPELQRVLRSHKFGTNRADATDDSYRVLRLATDCMNQLITWLRLPPQRHPQQHSNRNEHHHLERDVPKVTDAKSGSSHVGISRMHLRDGIHEKYFDNLVQLLNRISAAKGPSNRSSSKRKKLHQSDIHKQSLLHCHLLVLSLREACKSKQQSRNSVEEHFLRPLKHALDKHGHLHTNQKHRHSVADLSINLDQHLDLNYPSHDRGRGENDENDENDRSDGNSSIRHSVANSLLSHVRRCRDSAMTFQLLEILCLLAAHSTEADADSNGTGDYGMMNTMLDLSWAMLHEGSIPISTKQSASNGKLGDLSIHLLEVVSMIESATETSSVSELLKNLKSESQCNGLAALKDDCTDSSLLSNQRGVTKGSAQNKLHDQISRCLTRRYDKGTNFVEGMRRHWSLCILQVQEQPERLLGFLLACTETVMEFLRKAVCATDRSNGNSPQTQKYHRQHDGDLDNDQHVEDTADDGDDYYYDDDDDDDYRPQKDETPMIRYDATCAFKDLSLSSLASAYEVLLHMTIASLIFVDPTTRSTKRRPGTETAAKPSRNSDSPFRYVEVIFETFGVLIQTYRHHRTVFPPSFGRTVSSASKLMLSLSTDKLYQCTEWRSAQPSVSLVQKAEGMADPASAESFNELTNLARLHVCQKLEAWCGASEWTVAKKRKIAVKPSSTFSLNHSDGGIVGDGGDGKVSEYLIRAVATFRKRLDEMSPGNQAALHDASASTQRSMPQMFGSRSPTVDSGATMPGHGSNANMTSVARFIARPIRKELTSIHFEEHVPLVATRRNGAEANAGTSASTPQPQPRRKRAALVQVDFRGVPNSMHTRDEDGKTPPVKPNDDDEEESISLGSSEEDFVDDDDDDDDDDSHGNGSDFDQHATLDDESLGISDSFESHDEMM